MDYRAMDRHALQRELAALQSRYADFAQKGLRLDMSRGKPSPPQLDLSMGLLSVTDYLDEDGMDTRNYGSLEGVPEARRMFAQWMGTAPEEIFVGGCASLELMYLMVDLGWRVGFGGDAWQRCEKPKFLCPVPGYDRHFRIIEKFGIEMVSVPMLPTGPDMDAVEELVRDETVKGMWVVPVYSNPDGYTCSAETVSRMARMKTAAPGFKIFWDNAYGLHHLTENASTCPPILAACKEAGHADRPLLFMSTSKITFAGAGVGALGASAANMAQIVDFLFPVIISFDKLNQLRHVRFLAQQGGVKAFMKKHAAILRPKFAMIQQILSEHLRDCGGIARWTDPQGGYFVSFYTMDGCAARVVELCRQAGVVLTGAGAAFPYGKDPNDNHIRIAPTYPAAEELALAGELLCITTRLASCEKLLADMG